MSRCFFQSYWIDNPKLVWLREVPNDNRMAYCTLCNVKFSLSNMGLRAVTSHQKGEKHQLREKSAITSETVQNIFSSVKSSSIDPPSEKTTSMIKTVTDKLQSQTPRPASEDFLLSNPVQNQPEKCINMKQSQFSSSIEKYLLKDSVTRAEIMWCLETVFTHKSLRSAEKDAKLFPKIFPDSEIAKCLQLGRNKIAYILLYGISPLFKQDVLDELLSCHHFVVGFDESINKVTQKQQMDLNVRFWCSRSNEVKTRYLNSAFLGHTRATDLLAGFKSAIQPLDLKKLLQVSMDGPNVNKKFFRELKDCIKETPEDPEVLNIGSCGLHGVNVAFKTGVVFTGWNIVEFHRALYYLFKDSPARRTLYTHYSKSDIFPRKFCSIRWLENSSVAERSLDVIPHIRSFIDGVEKDKITPMCKSYKVVKNAISDQLLPSKLAFFLLVAREMESFLREYQSDVPLIPFLYNDLSSLMMRLIVRFVKKDLLKKNVMEINLEDTSNFLPPRQVDIGISTQCYLRKAKVSESEINYFRNDCRNFLVKCTTKLQERSPLIYELTKAVSCFDPKISLNQNLFLKRLTKLLLILCNTNWLSATAADQAKSQFKEICSQSHIISQLKCYRRSDRIDGFWLRLLSPESCDEAVFVIKIVMLLSHGNANAERGFSINKECLLENMKEESLVARRIIYDSIMAKGGLITFEISKKMVLFVRNARAKFAEAYESRRKEEKEKATALQKKREAEQELKKLETKRVKILEEAQKESNKIEEEIVTLRFLQKKNII